MKTVNTDYNFWLSGYYDDFNSARAVADDANSASYRTLDHTVSHFGSAIGKLARLNTRFKFSYPDRLRSGGYNADDPTLDLDYLYLATNETKLAYNDGIASWVTRDNVTDDPETYNSKAILQHPISIVGNRQKYNGSGNESYLAFRNGHDTQGIYYFPLGEMDFSYGSAPISKSNTADLTTPTNIHLSAGNPIPFYQKGNYRATGDASHDTPDKTMATVSFASVYTGEQPTLVASATKPNEYIHEITSPSKMPFLIHNLFVERGDGENGVGASTTSGTTRLMNYTGALRFKGIGESFHIRILPHVLSGFDIDAYTLKIGYKGSTTYDSSTDDWVDTQALISLNFDLADLGLIGAGALTKYQTGSPAELPQVDDWVDIEIVPDFALNTWRAYADGNTTSFANGVINIAGHDMETAVGWSLDLSWSHNADDYVCVSTLIDRVGVGLPLTNRFDGDYDSVSAVSSFDITYGANRVSSAEITILDDEKNYLLTPITTGTTAQDWRLLIFESGEDRPIWWGHIETIDHQQDAYKNTLQTTIRARDSMSILDRTLPIWELGQSAFSSLSNHISMDVINLKKASQTTAIANSLVFGIGNLKPKKSSIGFGKNDNQEIARYSNLWDSRQSLFTSAAIQMYINEDENGPNNIENEWLGFNAQDKMISDIVATNIYVNGTRAVYVKYDGVSTQGATDYRGISIGDYVKIQGSTFDGAYEVTDINYFRKKNYANGEVWVIFDLDDATALATSERLAHISTVEKLNIAAGGAGFYNYKMTTFSSHGLSIGDTVRLVLYSNSESTSGFNGEDYIVKAVPSATEFIIHEDEAHLPNLTGTYSVSSSYMKVYDYTVINGDTNIPPENPAILRHNYGVVAPDQVTYDQVQYRVAHARWMRDLPKSTWFKAQFGVIDPSPYWRSGIGSKLQHPYNSSQASFKSWPNADGSNDWVGLSSDINIGDTSITLDECGIWYHVTMNGLKEFIIDLIDIGTNETQFVIANSVSTPSFTASPLWDNSNKRFELSGAHSFSVGDIVAHVGFGHEHLDGMHMITEIPTSTTYKTTKIRKFVGTRDAYAYLQARQYADGSWSDGYTTSMADPDRITYTQLVSNNINTNANITGDYVYYGSCVVSGVKGIKREWKTDHTIYNLRKVDESNGYKHCFVMWADMRNDGKANADGGYRKNDFGLIIPTNENYTLTLTFADQINEYGNPDVFAELKIGEDADIWAFDSEVEPYSEGAWCDLVGGSNEEPYATHFHDWDEKAGAFCIIDVSRFWNLNTLACGGRSGYTSGGIVDFGDFETPTFGFPYLIDSYWKEATASYKNSHSEALFPYHENSIYFINDGTTLMDDVSIGDTKIYITDASQFDTSGYGVILCESGTNRDSEKIAYYFYWSGKGSETDSQGVVADYLDNVYITSYEVVTDPKNAKEQILADINAGLSDSQVSFGSNENLAEADQVEGNFDKVRVYNTTAALYGMRLILNLEGVVESPSQNSFFPDDKIRIMQNLNLADTWATNANLPCISDFNNVPIQKNNSSGDNYGSMVDGRGQTMMTILSTMQEKDGNGIAGDIKNLSWLIGRDNRMEFRDSINSNQSFSRSNLRVSNLNTQSGSKITNVRVYYNGNSSFVDYPEPSGADIRWRVLNHSDLFNRQEAYNLAKQEYLRETTARISVTAEVTQGNDHIMLGDGRYGYVADVFRKAYYNDSMSLSWWSNRLGGHPFCGIQNALDSSSYDAKSLTFGLIYAQLQEEDFPSTYGLTPHIVTRSGSAVVNPTTVNGDLIIDASASTFQFDLDGNTGTPVSIASAGWYELVCTISGSDYTLSVYYDGTTPSTYTTTLSFAEANYRGDEGNGYYFYGANSLSYAIQVAHVESGTNFVSSTNGNELRMFIEVTSGTTYADATFTLYLCDMDFDTTITSLNPPTLDVSNVDGYTSVVIAGNGYYRVQVPSSYDSDEPYITFSANIDYLRDLLRYRCGGSVANSTTSLYGITLSGTADSNSIFPLGMRKYSEMGELANTRAAYYAPRLHIIKDVQYVPATNVTYTDNFIDLTNENMVIKSIRWSQNERDVEKVTLNLEKIESHYAYSLVSVLSKPQQTHAPPKQQPPPPTPKPPIGNPLGGGGLGGEVAPAWNQSTGSPTTGDPSTDVLGQSALGFNQLSNNLIRNIRGKANFRSDTGTSGGTWGVLGSANTGVSSSFDKAIDGLEGSTSTSEGSAIATSDGFSLAGINDPEIGVQGEVHKHNINARIPNDTSTGFVTVIGNVTLESVSGGGDAEITTVVKCIETGAEISHTKIVSQGTTRQSITLLPSTYLNGAQTANNTLQITLERRPAQGNDTGGYQTLTVHNLEVSLRRFNIPNIGQGNAFRPY